MKAPKVKALTVMGWNIEHPKLDGPTMHYVLPADAESYERMVEQSATGIMRCWKGAVMHETWRKEARAALRAIGITPPKKGTNHAN